MTNKILEKALKICGYGNVKVISTVKITSDGKTQGHRISFYADKDGTAGSMLTRICGVASLKDVANSDPFFDIDVHQINQFGKWLDTLFGYSGTIKTGAIASRR